MMGMFSEIATEQTIQVFVAQIKQQLGEEKNPDAQAALKKLGRFALTQFEWHTPDWAKEYKLLFTETPPAEPPSAAKRKPLADWGNDNSSHENLVWWARVDKRYQCEVQRTSDRMGILVLFDHNDGDKELFAQEVGLSYGAIFGPDVDDVRAWQERCTKFIDEELPLQQQGKA